MNSEQTEKRSRRPNGTGSIYQQPGSTFWWIKYRQNGKVWRQSTETTKLWKAEKILAKRLAAVNSGSFVEPKFEKILVSELAEGFLRDYRINGKKSLDDAEARWEKHLEPFFGNLRAVNVSSDDIHRYIEQRQNEGAANATINRELAALRRMYKLGSQSTPPKVYHVPHFPMFKENNVRQGFIEDADFGRLAANASEFWLRTFLELAFTYGWRCGELLGLRVRQVDLAQQTIRLDVGSTKNGEGREVAMTPKVLELLRGATTGKGANDFVLTRPNGEPVREIRNAWQKMCEAAGLGKFVCRKCKEPVPGGGQCEHKLADGNVCGSTRPNYRGLIPHDMRRSAAKALRAAGVPESVVMATGGWKTAIMFRRYAIVSSSDQRAAMEALERRRAAQTSAEEASGHSLGIVGPSESEVATESKGTDVVQ